MRHPPLRVAQVALAYLLLSAGCATNLTNLKTAETLHEKQWRASAELGVFIPAGTLVRLARESAEQARRLAETRDGTLPPPTQEEQSRIFATTTSVVLFPPGTATNLQLRYGVIENLDLGLRLSTISQRFDARARLFHREREGTTHPGFHLALVAGAERQGFSGALWDALKKAFDILEWVGIDKPKRFDFDLTLLASWDFADIFKPYAGAVYRLGWFRLPEILTVPVKGGDPIVAKEDLSSLIHFMGVTLGAAVGYKWIHAFLELDIYDLVSKPTILGIKSDLGGLILFPAAGLALRFP